MKEQNSNVNLLRILACFSVIVLHTSAEHLYDVDYGSFASIVLNIGHGITRFAVTAFFLISGMLYLNDQKEYSISNVYLIRVWKYVVMYLFYDVFYAFSALLFSHSFTKDVLYDMRILVEHSIVSPKYHLWYLPAYVAVLLVLPLVKVILENSKDDKKIMEYILCFLIVSLLIKSLHAFELSFINEAADYISAFVPTTFLGWLGVCILGHYIDKYYTKKVCILNILGIISFLVGMILSYKFCENRIETRFYDNLTFQTAFFAAAIFSYFIKGKSILHSERVQGFINKIAGTTLGIYVIHPLFLNIFDKLGINSLMFNPIGAVFVVALLAFVCSFIYTSIVMKIPVISRFLV